MFAVVGLLLGILAYRENLPLTMKSCFYPLIGDCIFGWIGDAIDVISILATLFGVCTSLGIAARQVNMGLYVVFPKKGSGEHHHSVKISATNVNLSIISYFRIKEFQFLLSKVVEKSKIPF